ncbi:hypothetical protein IFM89_027401 [Coptis chinensis]|uniref:Uncharacterized protein n=1 Tax=Coptis chinensis TaxID=261450 RepID=A0A835IDH1_9MAGN|nr:hypothetical protein IFM89_027401 [Coptis chinensis]
MQKGFWQFFMGNHKFVKGKHVDSAHNVRTSNHQELAKELSVLQLIAIAGIAAALSAFCYAELASRCPSAGSAYHYSYICVGEGVAWLIGWALVLEYTIGGSAVAFGAYHQIWHCFWRQGWSPFFLGRVDIPLLDVVVDPCAALLVLIVTGLLCVGIKRGGWVGYELPSGYFPLGLNGMLAGSATVFFAYIGFDVVCQHCRRGEESSSRFANWYWGCCVYMLLCTCWFLLLLLGLYLTMQWILTPHFLCIFQPWDAVGSEVLNYANFSLRFKLGYIITAGAVTALCSTLMGSLLPQVTYF